LPEDHPYKKFEGQPKGMHMIVEEHGYVVKLEGGKQMVGDCMRCKLRNSCKVKCDKLESKEVNSEDSKSEDEGAHTNTCCLWCLLSMQEDFWGQKCLIQLVCSESVPHSSPFLHIFCSLPMVRLLRKAVMKVMSSTFSPSFIPSSPLRIPVGLVEALLLGMLQWEVWLCKVSRPNISQCMSLGHHLMLLLSFRMLYKVSTHLKQQGLQLNMLSRNINHTRVSHSGTLMQRRRSTWPKPLHFSSVSNCLFTVFFCMPQHALHYLKQALHFSRQVCKAGACVAHNCLPMYYIY